MVMAYWNGMKWEVSPKQISYLEALTTAYSIATETNADKEGKKPTEVIGKNLVEISFNTTYRVETGTSDIRGMLQKWESMVGKTAPLILGSAIFGPDRMQLQSVNVSNIEMNAKGVMRAATLSFKLKEFSEETEGVKTSSSSKGVKPVKPTALTVGVRNSDKASKKTVTIK